MAIDPQNTDAVAITQLDPLVLALESFLVGSNANGKMGNFTAQQLAEFIAPYISALGASPFVSNNGSPLPNPIEKPTAITFVGIGTFDQTTGADIVTTEELNVLFWSSNGVTGTWVIGVEVPIDLSGYVAIDDIGLAAGGKNQFNLAYVIPGKEYNGASHTLVTPPGGAADDSVFKIFCEANSVHSISGLPIPAGFTRFYAFITEDNVLVSGEGSITTTTTFKDNLITPNVDCYFAISLQGRSSTNTDFSLIQWESGAVHTAYEPNIEGYSEILGLPFIAKATPTNPSDAVSLMYLNEKLDEKITAVGEGIMPVNYNLANLVGDVLDGYEVYNTGVLTAQVAERVLFVKVVEGATYTISRLPAGGGGTGRNYAYYQDDKSTLIQFGANVASSILQFTFTVPAGCSGYFGISTSARRPLLDISHIQVELGTTRTDPWIAYGSRDFYNFAGTNGYNMEITRDKPLTPSSAVDYKMIIPTLGKVGALFGDSNTSNVSLVVDGSTFISNWPTYAAPLMGCTFLNYAIRGAMYKDFDSPAQSDQWLSVQINKAITDAISPDFICVTMGTNDNTTALGDLTTAMAKTTLASLDRTNLYEAIRWAFWTIKKTWNVPCFAWVPIQKGGFSPVALAPMHDAIIAMAKIYDFIIINASAEAGIIRDIEFAGPRFADTNSATFLHLNTAGKQRLGRYMSESIISKYKSQILI